MTRGQRRQHIWHSVFSLPLIYHNKALVITAVLSRPKKIRKFYIACKPRGSVPVLQQWQNLHIAMALIWTTELHFHVTTLSLHTKIERVYMYPPPAGLTGGVQPLQLPKQMCWASFCFRSYPKEETGRTKTSSRPEVLTEMEDEAFKSSS